MAGHFRRIVTGHDTKGQSIISQDSPPSRIQRIGGESGPVFYEIWNTRGAPADIERVMREPEEDRIILRPPKNGTRIRVLDIPPEDGTIHQQSDDERRAHFAEMGAANASTAAGKSGRHPRMHRTETVDYGIVLEGEIYLIVDDGEVLCKQGDIIVQCGTNHAWANRSGENCRIAFILIDGAFAEDIR